MADTDNKIVLTEETEEAIENLLKDARISARDFPAGLHRGRLLDDIDDDIETVRRGLDIEL